MSINNSFIGTQPHSFIYGCLWLLLSCRCFFVSCLPALNILTQAACLLQVWNIWLKDRSLGVALISFPILVTFSSCLAWLVDYRFIIFSNNQVLMSLIFLCFPVFNFIHFCSNFNSLLLCFLNLYSSSFSCFIKEDYVMDFSSTFFLIREFNAMSFLVNIAFAASHKFWCFIFKFKFQFDFEKV